MNLRACATASLLLVIGTAYADDASLKMRFVYEQTSSNLRNQITDTSQTVNKDLPNRQPVIDKEAKPIRDVVIYVDTGRGGVKLKVAPNNVQQRLLTIDRGQFRPRVLIARSGDAVRIVNRDLKRHHPLISFFNAPPVIVDLFPGRAEVVALPAIAPTVAPVQCIETPGMHAMLLIMDHPYSAVSEEDGIVFIEGLPTDTMLIFKVYHTRGSINQVQVDGRPVEWKRSRFEIQLNSGLNDMGDIVVPLSAFDD